MNTNFYSLWFDPPGIRTQVYRCSSRRSIHSTTDWLKYVSQFTYLHFGGGLSPPSSAKSWFCAKRRSLHLTFPSQYLLSHKKFLLRKLLMTSVHVICGLFSPCPPPPAPLPPNEKSWLRRYAPRYAAQAQ